MLLCVMKYGMPTAKAMISTPIRTPPHAQTTHEFWRYERGLIRRPAIPPSTASDVPVTDDASGLAR